MALSEWLARQIEDSNVFPGRKIPVINPAVDTSVFMPREKPAARVSFSLPEEELIVGLVATDPFGDLRKGWRLLQKALMILNNQHIRVRSVVTASSDELSRASVESAFWIPVGNVADKRRMSSLYSACDVVVVPSTDEAFGKVAAEAMSCGVPVVAFDGTGVADAVTHNETGYLAAHGSPEDLAVGISWAISASSDPAFTSHLRATSVSRFSIQRQAARYSSLYSSLLTGGDDHV